MVNKNVLVIGAMGRVGLPLTMQLKKLGYNVIGYDKNKEAIKKFDNGWMPFYEKGGQELLNEMHKHGHIQVHHDNGVIFEEMQKIDYIVITIGTPIDDNGNPKLDDLISLVKEDTIFKNMKDGVTIILRSTVAPGTTDMIYRALKLWDGRDVNIVFAPERISQGNALTELSDLPQLIGAYNSMGFIKAEEFFLPLVNYDRSKLVRLTPKEAEFAKLTTNMYRYINFAFANEIYMLASKEGVDAHKIIAAANYNYPRMNMPLPGPNVGGPCLYKDGRFLVTDEPFIELIQVAFQINEAMPNYILQRIKLLKLGIGHVTILGESFKAGNDDTRNSLSFKLKKILRRKGINFDIYDPMTNPDGYELFLSRLQQSPIKTHAFIIMTNHSEFKLAYEMIKEVYRSSNLNPVIADAWKMLDDSKNHHDGIYFLKNEENETE